MCDLNIVQAKRLAKIYISYNYNQAILFYLLAFNNYIAFVSDNLTSAMFPVKLPSPQVPYKYHILVYDNTITCIQLCTLDT